MSLEKTNNNDKKRDRGFVYFDSALACASGCFYLYPVLANIYLSFFKWKGMGHATFIGVDNYVTMFNDPTFWVSIKNTLILLLYIPMGAILPIMVSAILREGLKGWPFSGQSFTCPTFLVT